MTRYLDAFISTLLSVSVGVAIGVFLVAPLVSPDSGGEFQALAGKLDAYWAKENGVAVEVVGRPLFAATREPAPAIISVIYNGLNNTCQEVVAAITYRGEFKVRSISEVFMCSPNPAEMYVPGQEEFQTLEVSPPTATPTAP